MASSNTKADSDKPEESPNVEAARSASKANLNRDFFVKSFEIYGGEKGFIDYMPAGVSLVSNVLDFWRQHFVVEESMLEVRCPSVTPEIVLRASGHVERFTDLMVKDLKTEVCYRCDHLLKDFCNEKLEKLDLNSRSRSTHQKANELRHVLATLDNLSAEELGEKIKEYAITAPDTGNQLSDPYPFNLMFKTSLGHSDTKPGYLRPEIAQGMFVNFKTLHKGWRRKLPFATAQIGQAFRNEISPRQGPLRVCEFTLAEIEHFVDPEDKSHAKFSEVSKLEFLMLPREEQMSGLSTKRVQLGQAVAKGIVNNETLGFYIGRVYLFLTSLGIDKERLRFRQHLLNEMAHYATDCWDAEIECSYGWIECVGIADRSAYDLHAHSEKSGIELVASAQLSQPIVEEKLVIIPVDKELGPAFGTEKEMVAQALKAMNNKEATGMLVDFESNTEVDFYVSALGKNVSIKKNMVTISNEIRKQHLRVFTPSVIEPSFGIGRIVYCILEHSYYNRPTKDRAKNLYVLRFSPLVAPFKCSVFSIVKKEQYEKVAKEISKSLTKARIRHESDFIASSSSIGKKYVRADELGVPFIITVDSPSSATIRERDSKDQIRVNVEEVICVLKKLVKGKTLWEEVYSTFPQVLRLEDSK